MFESVAIVMQLIDEHPDAEIDPALMMYFNNAMRPGAAYDSGMAEKGRADFGVRATIVSDALADRDYLLGHAFSGADIVVGHACFMATLMGLIGDYPVLEAYYARLQQRPAHAQAYAADNLAIPGS